MVQTLAALLAWIAMLALICIGVLLSGIWRPRTRFNPSSVVRMPRLLSADQARAQSESIAQARAAPSVCANAGPLKTE